MYVFFNINIFLRLWSQSVTRRWRRYTRVTCSTVRSVLSPTVGHVPLLPVTLPTPPTAITASRHNCCQCKPHLTLTVIKINIYHLLRLGEICGCAASLWFNSCRRVRSTWNRVILYCSELFCNECIVKIFPIFKICRLKIPCVDLLYIRL